MANDGTLAAATSPTVTAESSASGSVRTPGRFPGSGGFCARRPSFLSCSTPSLGASTRLRAGGGGRRQLHGNRHAPITVPRPEPAFPPPDGGAAFASWRPLKSKTKEVTTTTQRACNLTLRRVCGGRGPGSVYDTCLCRYAPTRCIADDPRGAAPCAGHNPAQARTQARVRV